MERTRDQLHGEPIRILHLEDSSLDADLTLARLRRDGLDVAVTRVDSREPYEAAIRSKTPFDAIVSDYRLPQFDGMSALEIAQGVCPDVPFIFLSGVLGEENAIESLKLGATDYVLKQRMERLGPSVVRAIAEARERRRRRDVEQALGRSQAQLRFTLEAVRIGHWELDSSDRFVTRTPFFDRIFLADDAEPRFTLQQALTRVHRDDRPLVESQLRQATQPGGTCELECRIVYADDTERWIWLKGACGAGDPTGGRTASGLVMDITERKFAEHERERLLRSEREARSEAERASRLKDDFLATLSHELRTPLNAVLGWVQLLRRGVLPEADQASAIETIERNARLQAQLVEDLLDMSRITSGKLRLETEPTELASVLRAAVSAIQPAAQTKGVKITVEAADPSPVVVGDSARLQQVFWNLLSNAVKFTDAGGHVAARLTASACHAQITISDDGQGIEPGFLPSVFDRFRQQDSSIVRRQGGLGVGLSLVKRLVEMHGGDVTAHSDGIGRGSTFTVLMPLAMADADQTAQSVAKQNVPKLDGRKVLVVDDEADAREYVRRVLAECGAEVIVADSAASGMNELLAARPDLLLSDIGMPEEDGYSFIRKVRAHGDGVARIPAIALTAYARPEDRQRSLAAGFNDHLPKPLDVVQLLRRVGTMIGGTETAAARR